jgi:hypothetical protein
MFEPSLTEAGALKVAVGATLLIVTLAVYSVSPLSLSLIFPLTVRLPLSFVEQLAVLVALKAP